MRRYPKFLKTMPSFYGLVPADLLGLGCGLFLSMVLNLTPIVALILSAVLMGSLKLIRHYFDLVGFLMPTKRELKLKGGNHGTSV